MPKWVPARHLIEKVGPLLTTTESHQLLDVVIDHVRIIVGNAAQEVEAFNFLAYVGPEQSPSVELFLFIVWLCNHPRFLRRDRAAAMPLWLVEQLPELFSVAVTTAFSVEEGYGPDVLCGVLDGASAREPVQVWDKVAGAVDLIKVTQELWHVSRMAVLLRLASRAAEAGSTPAETAISKIKATFTGQRGSGGDPKLPPWAICLTREWRQIEKLVGADAVATWVTELNRLCAPLGVVDVRALEQAVSTSFREDHERPLNRWESRVRHALNLTLWSHLSASEAATIEAVLRIYNPSQPERTVKGMSNPVTDQLMAAIDSRDSPAAVCVYTMTRPPGEGTHRRMIRPFIWKRQGPATARYWNLAVALASTTASWASAQVAAEGGGRAGYDHAIGTAEESVLRMPGTQPVTFSGSMPSCLQIPRAVFFLISLCRGTVLF